MADPRRLEEKGCHQMGEKGSRQRDREGRGAGGEMGRGGAPVARYEGEGRGRRASGEIRRGRGGAPVDRGRLA